MRDNVDEWDEHRRQAIEWHLECIQCGQRHIKWPDPDVETLRCPSCGGGGRLFWDRSPRKPRLVRAYGFNRHKAADKEFSKQDDRGRGISKGEFDDLDQHLQDGHER